MLLANLLPACDRLVAVVCENNHRLADTLAAVGCGITPDAAGWIVALGDMPLIEISSHQAVATRLREGATLVTTQYQEQRGHPVGFSSRWSAEVCALTGDQGACSILVRHSSELVRCTVNDSGVLRDIDRLLDIPLLDF